MNFFALEWIFRVVCYDTEHEPDSTWLNRRFRWFRYLTAPTTLMDALAIFPYYLESIPHIFVSLRLLKSFRIFQLIRLGQYNELFLSLTNVIVISLNYLRLLILILAFGSAIFGSLIYWVERGTWQYHEKSGQFLFVRMGVDGVTEEPSPFGSIPQSFWWFLVTATTVGYGGTIRKRSRVSLVPQVSSLSSSDSSLFTFNQISVGFRRLLQLDYYPTSTAGKWIACFAMMMGVLVIAFPVSIFSDLWREELQKVQGFQVLHRTEEMEEDCDDGGTEKEDNDDLRLHEETSSPWKYLPTLATVPSSASYPSTPVPGRTTTCDRRKDNEPRGTASPVHEETPLKSDHLSFVPSHGYSSTGKSAPTTALLEDATGIGINADDIREIMECLRRIEEEQTRLRFLLQKQFSMG